MILSVFVYKNHSLTLTKKQNYTVTGYTGYNNLLSFENRGTSLFFPRPDLTSLIVSESRGGKGRPLVYPEK